MVATVKKKLRRPEKADANRRALFRAAAYVVGKHGYANASIGRITERCGLAQGTFYLYFKSRQDLFDQLLPTVGEEMLAHIGKAVRGSRDFFEVESRGLAAFFDYLNRNRGFFRILYETDAVSPEATRTHYDLLLEKYRAVIARACSQQQIRPLSAAEADVAIFVMMGARDYLYRHLVLAKQADAARQQAVVDAYIELLRNGLAPRASS